MGITTKWFGNPGDLSGCLIIGPQETGFNAQNCPTTPGFTGPIIDLSTVAFVSIASTCTGSARLWPIVLAEDDSPLTVVDGTGSPFWTLQAVPQLQDANSPVGLTHVGRVRLAVYGIAGAVTATVRLICKSRF